MTTWQGSRRAEGWLGRHGAVSLFRHMAGQCSDIATALDAHRDLDAIDIFGRLTSKMADAGKLAVFPKVSRTRRAPLRLVGS